MAEPSADSLAHPVSESVASACQYQPTSDDLSLEAGIRAAYDATIKAGTPEAQRKAFRLLADLVADRSPEMVAHLERLRGLAR